MKYMKSIILSIVIFTMMGCNKKDTIMNGLHGTVKVEEASLKCLALYQPVAIDLRYIFAVSKINNDL